MKHLPAKLTLLDVYNNFFECQNIIKMNEHIIEIDKRDYAEDGNYLRCICEDTDLTYVEIIQDRALEALRQELSNEHGQNDKCFFATE